jgi:MFS family permease
VLRSFFNRTFSGLPRTFWILIAGTLINRLGGFVTTFLSLYLTTERGMTIVQAGATIALYGAGTIPAGLVGGTLADRLGRRTTMMISLVASSVFMCALGFAREPGTIGVLTLLLGLTADLYRPAVSATVADVVPPKDRLRAYSLLHWTVNIGFSIAPVVAGLMASRSYLALFVADAATTFAYAMLAWFMIPETRGSGGSVVVEGQLKLREVLVALKDLAYLPFLGLTFCLALLYHQTHATLALDMRAHGVDASTFGKVMALNGVLIVLFQPATTQWLSRFKRSRVLAGSCLLTGVGFGITGLATSAPLYALSVVIWTMGEIGGTPAGQALVADLAPPDARGRYQGAYYMAWGSAFFAAPLLGSVVLEKLGSVWLWGGCFGMGILLAIGHVVTAGARQRRLAVLRPDLAVGRVD